MQPRFLTFFAMVVLGIADSSAMALQLIQLAAPADRSEIEMKCNSSFKEADDDKRAYEGSHGLSCLSATLATEGAKRGSNLEDRLKQGYMIQCRNTFTARANSIEALVQHKVEIPWETVQGIYDSDAAYGFAFKVYCMDGEITKHQNIQGQGVVREGGNDCRFAFHAGCP